MDLSDGYFVKDEHGEEYRVLSTNVVGYRVEDDKGDVKTISYENAGMTYRKDKEET